MTSPHLLQHEALVITPLVGERWPLVAPLGTTLIGLAATVALASRLSAPPASLPVRPPPTALASAAPITAPAPATAPAVVASAAPASAVVTSAPADCLPLFDATFEYGQSVPRFDPEAARRAAEWLTRHPGVTLAIDGHADAQGSTSANLALSHQRAARVGNALVAAGLPRERFTVRAFGAYAPLPGRAENDAGNRRVSFEVIGAAACPSDAPRPADASQR
jgi:outer membrane protein OmpA-like peptidoglycan-associated protein